MKKFERERTPDTRYTITMADGTVYLGVYVHWRGGPCNSSPGDMFIAFQERVRLGIRCFAEWGDFNIRIYTGLVYPQEPVDIDIRKIKEIVVFC